ncbi:hypothetical protein [Roseivivax halodurans]|nr:hypothetical protein [Roseivivax halodurans]
MLQILAQSLMTASRREPPQQAHERRLGRTRPRAVRRSRDTDL